MNIVYKGTCKKYENPETHEYYKTCLKLRMLDLEMINAHVNHLQNDFITGTGLDIDNKLSWEDLYYCEKEVLKFYGTEMNYRKTVCNSTIDNMLNEIDKAKMSSSSNDFYSIHNYHDLYMRVDYRELMDIYFHGRYLSEEYDYCQISSFKSMADQINVKCLIRDDVLESIDDYELGLRTGMQGKEDSENNKFSATLSKEYFVGFLSGLFVSLGAFYLFM